MRVIFSLSLFLWFVSPAKTQMSFGVYAFGVKQQTNMTIPTLAPLVQDINTHYSSQLATPMGDLVFKNGISWGGGFFALAVGMDLNFGKQSAYSEAVFTNGEKYEIHFDAKEWDYDFNFFLPLGPFGRLGGFIGGNSNKGDLKIGYRYADGDLSYGIEKPMNGIYRLNSFRTVGGFKAMLGYKWVNFYFKAAFVGFMDKLTGDTKLGVKDHVGEGFGLFSNHEFHQYLPQDVDGQNNVYAYNVGQGPQVMQQLRGWKFQFGIALVLGKFVSKDDQ